MVLKSVPVRRCTGHSGRLAGGVLSPNYSSWAPTPMGLAYLRPVRTCLLDSQPPQRGSPARCPEGSAALQERSTGPAPGSSPRRRRRCPRAAPFGSWPNLSRRPAPTPPPRALRTWSWPKARSAAVTPVSRIGMRVSATDEILPRARGVPDPWKSWSDRPPRGGVTIRSQKREPGPPLGPAVRRHQLHPRSGAHPRLPRDGEKRKK